MQLQLDEKKINEGRLLAVLGLEERLLAKDALLAKPLSEKISLAKGILQGTFEKGFWIEGLKRAYESGPVASLFDGNHEEIVSWAIASAQQQEKNYIHSELERVFFKQWSADQVVRFVTSVPLEYSHYTHWFTENEEKLSQEQKKVIQNQLGELALYKEAYSEACSYFEQANNLTRVKGILEQLVEQLNDNNVPNTLYVFIKYTAEKGLVETLMKKVLACGNDAKISGMYELQKKYGIELSGEEQSMIERARIKQMNRWDINDADQQTQLKWAKTHWCEEPQESYFIMKEQKYCGAECIYLVKKIIENGWSYGSYESTLREVGKEDAYLVFDTLSIGSQARVAEYFDDQEKMREVSKKYISHADEVKDKEKPQIFRNAYDLWIKGKGSADDAFVKKLREKLTQENKNYCGWLHKEDTYGRVEAFYRVIESDAKSAYELVESIKNSALVDLAREKFVQQSPEKAWEYFNVWNHEKKEERDGAGVKLALETLGKKYSLSLEQVKAIVAT